MSFEEKIRQWVTIDNEIKNKNDIIILITLLYKYLMVH